MEKTNETIKLFKGVIVADDIYNYAVDESYYNEVCIKTIPLGFVFDPRALVNNSSREIDKIIAIVKKEFCVTGREGCKFYFTESNMESGVSAKETKAVGQARTFLYNYYANSINLNELLELSGAELVEQDECDIDLSPEALEKDTILNLMVSKDE